ncbi:MAG: hypothetical protein ACRD8K_10185 [Nitrososphaeraceae archaeon]
MKTIKYLNNKKDRKTFDDMFSIANLYNSACSYVDIPIRIHPIIMSIVFHHYKTLKEKNNALMLEPSNLQLNNYNNNNSIILQKELDKWKTYSNILRQPNRDLFIQMLQSVDKYSNFINAKEDNYATESLLMSLLLEQHKELLQQ